MAVCTADIAYSILGNATFNTVCHDLTICTASEYAAVPAGLHNNRECVKCTKCGNKEYEVQPCTETANRVCETVTPCNSWSHEVVEPTKTSDRECVSHQKCSENEYLAVAGTATADGECKELTDCAAGRYETKKPTATSDRECERCIEGDGFTTAINQRKCTACSFGLQCKTGEYVAECETYQDQHCAVCKAGTFLVNGTSQCKRWLEPCYSGEWQSLAPTSVYDRICTPCQNGTFRNETAAEDSGCATHRECVPPAIEADAGTAFADRQCKTNDPTVTTTTATTTTTTTELNQTGSGLVDLADADASASAGFTSDVFFMVLVVLAGIMILLGLFSVIRRTKEAVPRIIYDRKSNSIALIASADSTLYYTVDGSEPTRKDAMRATKTSPKDPHAVVKMICYDGTSAVIVQAKARGKKTRISDGATFVIPAQTQVKPNIVWKEVKKKDFGLGWAAGLGGIKPGSRSAGWAAGLGGGAHTSNASTLGGHITYVGPTAHIAQELASMSPVEAGGPPVLALGAGAGDDDNLVPGILTLSVPKVVRGGGHSQQVLLYYTTDGSDPVVPGPTISAGTHPMPELRPPTFPTQFYDATAKKPPTVNKNRSEGDLVIRAIAVQVGFEPSKISELKVLQLPAPHIGCSVQYGPDFQALEEDKTKWKHKLVHLEHELTDAFASKLAAKKTALSAAGNEKKRLGQVAARDAAKLDQDGFAAECKAQNEENERQWHEKEDAYQREVERDSNMPHGGNTDQLNAQIERLIAERSSLKAAISAEEENKEDSDEKLAALEEDKANLVREFKSHASAIVNEKMASKQAQIDKARQRLQKKFQKEAAAHTAANTLRQEETRIQLDEMVLVERAARKALIKEHKTTHASARKKSTAADNAAVRSSSVRMVLHVEGLLGKDLSGTSDPYLELSRMDGTVVHKTAHLMRTTRPQWEAFDLKMSEFGEEGKLAVKVMDWDKFTKNDFVGGCELLLSDVCAGEHASWSLVNPKKAAKEQGYTNSGVLWMMGDPKAQKLNRRRVGKEVARCEAAAADLLELQEIAAEKARLARAKINSEAAKSRHEAETFLKTSQAAGSKTLEKLTTEIHEAMGGMDGESEVMESISDVDNDLARCRAEQTRINLSLSSKRPHLVDAIEEIVRLQNERDEIDAENAAFAAMMAAKAQVWQEKDDVWRAALDDKRARERQTAVAFKKRYDEWVTVESNVDTKTVDKEVQRLRRQAYDLEELLQAARIASAAADRKYSDYKSNTAKVRLDVKSEKMNGKVVKLFYSVGSYSSPIIGSPSSIKYDRKTKPRLPPTHIYKPIKAVAVLEGYSRSPVATTTLVLPKADKPSITCENGQISIATEHPLGVTYYTVNGPDPVAPSFWAMDPSKPRPPTLFYGGTASIPPIAAGQAVTIKAVTRHPLAEVSETAVLFVLEPKAVVLNAPFIAPHRSPQGVEVFLDAGDSAPGDVEIYYTVDGESPMGDTAELYDPDNPFFFAASASREAFTVRAVTICDDSDPSPISSTVIEVGATPQLAAPTIVSIDVAEGIEIHIERAGHVHSYGGAANELHFSLGHATTPEPGSSGSKPWRGTPIFIPRGAEAKTLMVRAIAVGQNAKPSEVASHEFNVPANPTPAAPTITLGAYEEEDGMEITLSAAAPPGSSGGVSIYYILGEAKAADLMPGTPWSVKYNPDAPPMLPPSPDRKADRVIVAIAIVSDCPPSTVAVLRLSGDSGIAPPAALDAPSQPMIRGSEVGGQGFDVSVFPADEDAMDSAIRLYYTIGADQTPVPGEDGTWEYDGLSGGIFIEHEDLDEDNCLVFRAVAAREGGPSSELATYNAYGGPAIISFDPFLAPTIRLEKTTRGLEIVVEPRYRTQGPHVGEDRVQELKYNVSSDLVPDVGGRMPFMDYPADPRPLITVTAGVENAVVKAVCRDPTNLERPHSKHAQLDVVVDRTVPPTLYLGSDVRFDSNASGYACSLRIRHPGVNDPNTGVYYTIDGSVPNPQHYRTNSRRNTTRRYNLSDNAHPTYITLGTRSIDKLVVKAVAESENNWATPSQVETVIAKPAIKPVIDAVVRVNTTAPPEPTFTEFDADVMEQLHQIFTSATTGVSEDHAKEASRLQLTTTVDRKMLTATLRNAKTLTAHKSSSDGILAVAPLLDSMRDDGKGMISFTEFAGSCLLKREELEVSAIVALKMSSPTPDAVIHYTTNGQRPFETKAKAMQEKSALAEAAGAETAAESINARLKARFNDADVSDGKVRDGLRGVGKLNSTELMHFLLQGNEFAEILKEVGAFSYFDTDNSGTLDMHDFKGLLGKLDTDDDNQVSWEELRHVLISAIQANLQKLHSATGGGSRGGGSDAASVAPDSEYGDFIYSPPVVEIEQPLTAGDLVISAFVTAPQCLPSQIVSTTVQIRKIPKPKVRVRAMENHKCQVSIEPAEAAGSVHASRRSSLESFAEIHYTTDGSDPILESPVFNFGVTKHIELPIPQEGEPATFVCVRTIMPNGVPSECTSMRLDMPGFGFSTMARGSGSFKLNRELRNSSSSLHEYEQVPGATTLSPIAGSPATSPGKSGGVDDYADVGRLALVKLCKERDIECKAMERDVDALRRMLRQYDLKHRTSPSGDRETRL
jgi:hypothetical protein